LVVTMKNRILLGVGGVLAVAIVAFLLTNQPPPTGPGPVRPEAAVQVGPVVPTPAEIEIARASLGIKTTIDSASWDRSPREARMEQIKGMFRARGLDIAQDGSVLFESDFDAQLSVKLRLEAVRFMKNREVVQTLPVSEQPKPQLVNEGQRATLTLQDLAPGVDVRFTYDGNKVKEDIILREEVRKGLATAMAAGADRFELAYRFEEMKAANGGPAMEFLDDSGQLFADADIGVRSFGLYQGGMLVFRFEPAFIDQASGRVELKRRLDLTDAKHPLLTVEVPVAVLTNVDAWPVTIDPTIVDDRRSMSDASWSREMVRDSDGVLHKIYNKYDTNPDGRWRWSLNYATGVREPGGMVWTHQGFMHPVHYRSGEWSDQWHGSLCIQSDGTLHGFSREYRREDSQWEVNHAYKPAGEDWIDTGVIQRNGTYSGEPDCAVGQNDEVYVAMRGNGSGCLVVATWDPDETSLVEPLGVGQGGDQLIVQGGWRDLTTIKCEWNSSSNIVVDNENTVIPIFTRYRGGAWLYYRDDNGDYEQKNWFNNRNWDEFYQPWRDPNGNRGTDAANIGNHEYASNAYHYNPDFTVDERGDIHAVTQLRFHNWGNGSHGGRYLGREHGFERVAYARYDKAAGRWTDWAWPRGNDTVENNRWLEREPVVIVDDPDPDNFGNRGNVHVLFWAESIPRKVKYARLPVVNGGYHYDSPSNNGWQDLEDLVHGGGPIRFHVQGRGRLWPESDRVAEDLLDITFIEDNTALVYVSTGQPVELVRLKKPRNHRYTRETQPTFQWNRVSTDASDGRTTYVVEIATSPVFAENEMLHTSNPIDGTSYELPVVLQNGQYYYWRVTPTNAVGPGFPSEPYELGVDTEPPRAFNLLTPENNSDPRTKTPTFTWEEAQD
jgi:hypothetical protein